MSAATTAEEVKMGFRSDIASNMSLGAFLQSYGAVPVAGRVAALARLRGFGLPQSDVAARLLAATWGIA